VADDKSLVIKTLQEAGKPLRTGDIAKIANLDSKKVSAIIKELKKEGTVVSPKRCYYEIKKD